MLAAYVRKPNIGPAWRCLGRRRAQRSFASAAALPTIQVGSRLHGFTVENVASLEEWDLEAVKMKHHTGAEYVHLAKKDSNNQFSIGFQTIPPDKTGLPHILEHMALAGSKNYPIRDPFFKMIPRSFSTSMNAMTYPDRTEYPFGTTNRQDFENLVSVYMDATLQPLLRELDFAQEGWRLGPVNASDSASSPLEFKGVVYNEMKGVMSDASYLFYIRYAEHMAPGLHNSGGDPAFITDLSHAQLSQYHANTYHPSNAKIITYGDGSLQANARIIAHHLDRYDCKATSNSIVEPISLAQGPFSATVEGPLDPLLPPTKQCKTVISWETCKIDDFAERLAMDILSSLLTSGFGSPLYRALIGSGLGTGFSPVDGIGSFGTKSFFSIGLVGVEQEAVDKVKQVIYQTLAQVHATGFDKAQVDGRLHQIEFGMKHKSAFFGTAITRQMSSDWYAGADPIKALEAQKTIDEFKRRNAQPGYLEALLKEKLLNDKTMTFTMVPSPLYNQALAGEEKSRLEKKFKQVESGFASSLEAAQHIAQQEAVLESAQMKTEDLSVLPTLRLDDIPRASPVKSLTESTVCNVPVQWRETATNGITYFSAINVFDHLPAELRELIPLFTSCIRRIGTKHQSMDQLEEEMRQKTGSIAVSYHATTSPANLFDYEEGIAFTGRAFDRNVVHIFDLLNKLVLNTDFDSPEAAKMIKELLLTSTAHTSDLINDGGNAYATTHASAGLTPESTAVQATAGLSQLRLMLNLASQQVLTDVIEKLKLIQRLALSDAGRLRIFITCGPEARKNNEEVLKTEFLSARPSMALNHTCSISSANHSAKSFIHMPYQVSHVGFVLPGVPYLDPRGAALAVLSKLLTYNYLHREIRERGGAYGAGASYGGLSGTFSMFSYRDPNPGNTLSVMRNAASWLLDRSFTDSQLEEAKISIFKGIDAPQSVNQESLLYFNTRLTSHLTQQRRELLLDVTHQHMRDAAEQILGDMKTARQVVIGPRAPFKQEIGWRTIDNLAL